MPYSKLLDAKPWLFRLMTTSLLIRACGYDCFGQLGIWEGCGRLSRVLEDSLSELIGAELTAASTCVIQAGNALKHRKDAADDSAGWSFAVGGPRARDRFFTNFDMEFDECGGMFYARKRLTYGSILSRHWKERSMSRPCRRAGEAVDVVRGTSKQPSGSLLHSTLSPYHYSEIFNVC